MLLLFNNDFIYKVNFLNSSVFLTIMFVCEDLENILYSLRIRFNNKLHLTKSHGLKCFHKAFFRFPFLILKGI